MAKKGFKAVALNDSFDEPPRRHREEEEEEEEENDDDINNNESEATPSSTATKNNNNDEFVTPMTTFHSTKTNTNNNNTKTTTTFIGVGSNEKIVGSNESSPNSATRQSMESRDTISELPQTPKRDLYFEGGEDFRHQHNRSISATSMDGLISRLDEESGSGGGERTSVRFNEFSDAFGGRLGARERGGDDEQRVRSSVFESAGYSVVFRGNEENEEERGSDCGCFAVDFVRRDSSEALETHVSIVESS